MALFFHAAPVARAQQLFERPTEAIPPDVERMYVKGLQYLVKSQNEGGTWPEGHGAQPAVVGLALLCMLAHGDDPNTGPYSLPIKRGLEFILSQQNKQTGYIGSTMYNHGFGALA